MKLISLKLENFRQHEDSYLEFNDGITIISGTNGAGKSTILEAITWALYGTEAARGNKDTIKFNRAKPRSKVMVELMFELDGTTYWVVRYLEKAEVYVGKEEAPVVTSQQEVTKYLTEKIGMNRNEFFNTYFTGQKELNFMKNQGPTERRKFISKVMSFDKIREAQEKARIDKNKLENEIRGLSQGLDNLEELEKEKKDVNIKLTEIKAQLDNKQKKFNRISDEVAKIEPEWEKIKAKKEKFDKTSWEINSQKDKQQYLQKNEENLSGQLKSLEEKTKKLAGLAHVESEYKNIEQKIKDQEALQEKDALRQKYLTRLEGSSGEIKEKQAQLEEIVKSGKDKKAQIEKLPAIEKEIAELNAKIQEIEINLKEIQKIEKQLAVITEKGPEGICPTCERPLKDEYDKVTGNFKAQITELSKGSEALSALKNQKSDKEKGKNTLTLLQGDYEAEKRRYLTVKNEIETKNQEIEKINKELAGMSDVFNIEALKALREQIVPLQKKYNEFLSLKGETSGFERIKKELEELLKAKYETEDKLKALSEGLKTLEYSEEKFREAEKNYKEVKDGFYKEKEELLKTQGEEKIILGELDRISRIEQSNAEKQKLINEKQERFNLLYELDRFYGQLWEKLNNEVRPEIADLAGKFLSDLTDNRYSELEITEKYDIQLHDEGEIKQVISGGEEDIVNLCIRLAISQIIAHRSGKALSLLILDEIFGSLDESRRNNVITLLRKLTGNFEQVILITHIDDMKDETDHIISLEFDPESGSSKVVNTEAEEMVPELVG